MATLVSNDFASATNLTTATGSPGTLTVSGGFLLPSAVTSDSAGYSTTSMPGNDHWVEAVMTRNATVNFSYNYIVARWDGDSPVSGTMTGYMFGCNFADAELAVYNSDAGTQLALISAALPGSATYTLRLEVVGNQISAKINGTHISGSPFTDSTISTGTRVGFSQYNTTTTGDTKFDSWTAGDFDSSLPFAVLGRFTPGTVSASNVRR